MIPEECSLELVLVDNASSDGTSRLIEVFEKETEKFQVIHLREERLGKSFALNNGICAAKGDFLAFIDDDHIVSDDYLIAVIRTIEEHDDYSMFCGRVLPSWDGSEPQWVHDNDRYPIRPFPVPRFDLGEEPLEISEDKGFIPGSGNLIMKKEVFQRIGFFSEELGPKGHNLRGGEDIEFVRRALRKGEKILYVPHVLQHHQVFSENLRISYLVKKAYLRSIAAYQFARQYQPGRGNHRVPNYLFRQAMTRLVKAALSISRDARRYYIVRFAAALGEINGRIKASASLSRDRSS
jgi:glycosyltransferase involved in cell wall biosynthesis